MSRGLGSTAFLEDCDEVAVHHGLAIGLGGVTDRLHAQAAKVVGEHARNVVRGVHPRACANVLLQLGYDHQDLARQIAAGLTRHLGQNVIVDNKVGAGGTIGTGAAAKAPPDGYTILLGTTSALAVSPALYPSVPYDPLKSFIPVSEVTRGPFLVTVKASLPVKDIKELIDYARKNPGKLNAGSAGNGSVHHLALEIFKQVAGDPPEDVRFYLGYAGWGPGQLEQEIAQGAWLSAPATPELIFGSPSDQMWERVVRGLGIDPVSLVSTSGIH